MQNWGDKSGGGAYPDPPAWNAGRGDGETSKDIEDGVEGR